MKPYSVKTTFDCIKAGDKFRFNPVDETFLKIEPILSGGYIINCIKIKTGTPHVLSGDTEIYVKG